MHNRGVNSSGGVSVSAAVMPKLMIADATDAKAASGATAAPMFAQPRAII